MTRPFSIAQIDKLGKRLRTSAQPLEEDLDLLQQLRASYDAPMAFVEERLRSNLGLSPLASRLKTVGTIIDKLKRDATRLSRMQDIAGVRHVVDGNTKRQNVICDDIVRLFPDSRVIDRRESPNHGYRAVHIVVEVDGCPIEIQVRTHLQDLWAQIMEKLADMYGRELRYDPPEGEESHPLFAPMVTLSEQIALVERRRPELEQMASILEGAPRPSDPSARDPWEGLRGYHEQEEHKAQEAFDRVKKSLEGLLTRIAAASG